MEKNWIARIIYTVQIVFIILKLCNLINWSWWLVFIPFYIHFGLLILLFIVLGIVYYIREKI